MGNFKRHKSIAGKTSGRHAKHGSYGSNGPSSTGRFTRSDDRPSRGGFNSAELHEATCSKCGKTCEVPFKPNGKRPVFCRDCFKKSDAPAYGKSYDRPSYDRPAYRKPFGKPSYGKRDYPKKETDYSAVLEEINSKLNKILGALEQE